MKGFALGLTLKQRRKETRKLPFLRVTGMVDEPCPFTIQNLIKITIFKMMALHGTLVCDSKDWCTY